MPDPALRRGGRWILVIGIASLIVGIVGYNLTGPSTAARHGSNGVLDVGVLLLMLGAIAWALGGIRSTVAEDRMNLGLRRTGFLLLVVGVLTGIAGVVAVSLYQNDTASGIGLVPISSVGFYVAIIGSVLVSLSHREWASGTGPPRRGTRGRP